MHCKNAQSSEDEVMENEIFVHIRPNTICVSLCPALHVDMLKYVST